MTEKMYLKPLLTGAIAGGLDRYYLGMNNTNSNLMFAGAVGAAIYASELIAPSIPNIGSLSDGMLNNKNLAVRLTEIGLGSAFAVGVNRYLGNEYVNATTLQRVGVVIVSDVLGEYASDYLTNKPLDYLSSSNPVN